MVAPCMEGIAVNYTALSVTYRIESSLAAIPRLKIPSGQALNRHSKRDVLVVESAFTEAEKDLSGASGHYCPSSLAQDLAKLKHRAYL
ncbi:MAG TPA: hypothetical protein VKB96_12905, partial [Gammaproteobacteria bacterium]|nr:hypothetical protein [Gammaproteobacteria bacterium]